MRGYQRNEPINWLVDRLTLRKNVEDQTVGPCTGAWDSASQKVPFPKLSNFQTSKTILRDQIFKVFKAYYLLLRNYQLYHPQTQSFNMSSILFGSIKVSTGGKLGRPASIQEHEARLEAVFKNSFAARVSVPETVGSVRKNSNPKVSGTLGLSNPFERTGLRPGPGCSIPPRRPSLLATASKTVRHTGKGEGANSATSVPAQRSQAAKVGKSAVMQQPTGRIRSTRATGNVPVNSANRKAAVGLPQTSHVKNSVTLPSGNVRFFRAKPGKRMSRGEDITEKMLNIASLGKDAFSLNVSCK